MSRVELAVTPLAPVVVPGIPTGYHSSVMVDGEEFFFSDGGVGRSQDQASHRSYNNKTRVTAMGTTDKSKTQLLAALEPHFRAGTYDLLRKNCNSFSDCALFFLLQKRLPREYCALEGLGASAPAALVRSVQGQYKPNPLADGFSVDGVMRGLDPQRALREAWGTPGRATGGPAAASAEAMRAARLARLGAAGTPAPDAPGAAPDPRPRDPPPARGPAAASDLLDDARLARLVQLEEEAAATIASGGTPSPAARASTAAQGPPQQQPQQPQQPQQQQQHHHQHHQQSDEELARALQAEEDAQAGGGAARARQRQTRPPLGASVHPGSPFEQMLQAVGLVGASAVAGRGQPAAAAVQRPGHGRHGDDAVQQLQEVMLQLNRQLAPQVRQFDSQLRQVNAQLTPQLRQFNAQLQPHLQGVQEQIRRLEAQLQGRTPPGRGASARSIDATTTVTTYERSPSSPEGASGGEGEQCMVCLDNFRAGDQIRILPCMHRFHVFCIDPWLRRNCCCPNCNHRFGPQ